MCGEKKSFANSIEMELGSPPHVRGKACAKWLSLFRFGITPACAGKRSGIQMLQSQVWDHPRMCGEKLFSLVSLCWETGSPPHVRGKVFYAVHDGLL